MQAFHLAASSKKGFSAHQLHRTLGVTYKSAWFMHHRIMEAMREGNLITPLGGQGKVVEADETYIGRRKDAVMKRGGAAHKMAVISSWNAVARSALSMFPRLTKRLSRAL